MLAFAVRRLGGTFLVLLGASFVVYLLAANAGDPLRELRGSRDPGAAARIADVTARLDLDTPVLLRYTKWLGGAAGCLVGRCDLGISVSRGDQQVTTALAEAMASTLSLVTAATVLAIVVGVAVGMTTALRRDSGYDYAVTLLTLVLYSLPVFWVAVLLKEWGAVRFNGFLAGPGFSALAVLLLSAAAGAVLAAVVGGSLRTRIRHFLLAGAGTGILLALLNATSWLSAPAVGVVGVGLSALAIAGVVAALSTGLRDRRALLAGGVVAAAVVLLWFPLQQVFFHLARPWILLATPALLALLGAAAGHWLGGNNKRAVVRAAALTGALCALPLYLDQMLLRWGEYTQKIPLPSGVIATTGARTPGLTGDMWLHLLDGAAHLVLPTIALTLVSLATYTRYSRAGLLEVLHQDYVRTARAKGLPERTVILRHAFRNAMIPLATIVAFDFGGLIGGAIVTERIFAWQGMGSLFSQGLEAVDVNLLMGFFLVVGLAAVAFNILADLAYAALDPRIRTA